MPYTPHVEQHFTAGLVVRDTVIGLSDGLTVPFALAAGLTGAVDSTSLVVTAGLAEIAAGAIAMGLGGYLAGKSDVEHYASERRREQLEIEQKPDVEAMEVMELLQEHGLTADESAPVVAALRKRPEAWRDFMLRFELGLEKPDPRRAVRSGAVIATAGLPRELERLDSRLVRASAGLACMLLAKRCVRWQLGPGAFFAGIPGTVGGALAMNAGAFGGETWTHVESVTTIDRGGEIRERARAEFEISYRTVRGPANEWFLGAKFRFDHDASSSMDAIKALLARRNAAQPLGVPSCGSVFRNPPGDFAGRLIEQAGLKGLKRGGAMVSDKHANFILNVDDASAADIEALIGEVQAAVQRTSGVLLEPEVRVIGEPLATQAKGDR